MACLAECGIPPLEILSMATLGNAQMLGIDKVCGSVETGKRANLVVLGSDPLEDIKNTKDIKYVIN
jgi:imidazolonepropionase-like amidohydrolase